MAEIYIVNEMSCTVTSTTTTTHSVKPETNTPFQFQTSREITTKCNTCGKYVRDERGGKFCSRHTEHTGDNGNSKHRSNCDEHILKSQLKYMPIE
jgi:hypothetical protein